MTNPSLAGMRVAITREAGQCEQSARDVLHMGGVPCVFPLLHIAPVAERTELSAALDALASGDIAAFTSANGVNFSLAIAPDALLSAATRGVRFAAVGELTAAALRARPLAQSPIVPPQMQSGAGLAEALLQETARGECVLVLGAQESRRELPDALRAAGRQVRELAVYQTQTRAPSELWAAVFAQQVDAVVFASPSAVQAFVHELDLSLLPDRVRIACIGNTTRDAATALGLRVDVMPDQPSMQGVLRALAGAA